MNRKALFLLASVILSTGVVVSDSVEAKVVDTHYNGAVIRQLHKDNSKEYYEILEKYNYDDTSFDFQVDLINYYEEHSDFVKADFLFENMVNTVKRADSYTKRACVQKYRNLLEDKLVIQPSSPRYYYMLYIWEKNFGNDPNFAMYNLKQALSLDRANVYYEYEYAKQFIGTSENDNAINLLKSLQKAQPGEVEFRKSLAEAYKYAGNYKEAKKEYKIALAFEPSNTEIANALKNIYSKESDTKYSKNIQPVSATNTLNANMQTAVDKKAIKAEKKKNKRIKNSDEQIIKKKQK